MRDWCTPALLVLIAACSSDRTSPGVPPDVPASLSSTTLDGAAALSWTDNSYTSDPGNFESYRIYSTSYDIDTDSCGASWGLEGTTVAPEFLVGALVNGISRCFAVSARSIDGAESARSATVWDTPRPDTRNVALFIRQSQNAQSGFRFWEDLNSDQQVQDNELGLVRDGSSPTIDFAVERDLSGLIVLAPVRAGTGVEFYNGGAPVGDLTSIDFAPCTPDSSVDGCAPYTTSPIEATPGTGYVFETDGGDGVRFGSVRVTHVGQTFLILDWAFQTDRGNPQLLVATKTGGR